MFYRQMVRPMLYRMGRGDPEMAHERTLEWLKGLGEKPALVNALNRVNAVRDPCRVFGIDFPNAVGLAAGMDKDGTALAAWPALGFGFVELGTVTWWAQNGNPRPRLYRLPESQALINRMGFNNEGAQAMADRLANAPRSIPVGISIGKSKSTPLEQALDDYVASFNALHRYGDYFAINVSSPNTPGLRKLQDAQQLAQILKELYYEAKRLSPTGRGKPLLVKLAPDLTEHAMAEAIEVCLNNGASGIIAANTTLGRDGLAASDLDRSAQSGGLSGKPLRLINKAVVSFVHRETAGRLPIIGVGGIASGSDAAELIDAGASLVQLYTGLVYQGPTLVRKAARGARKQLQERASYSAPQQHPQGGGYV